MPKFVKAGLTLALALAGAASAYGEGERPRPAGVPPQAVWSGGPDGGNWFECFLLSPEERRFRCVTYWDSGDLKSLGEYVLVGESSNKPISHLVDLDGFIKESLYTLYGGTQIYLADEMNLWPDSAVIWPFSLDKYAGKIVINRKEEPDLELQYDRNVMQD